MIVLNKINVLRLVTLPLFILLHSCTYSNTEKTVPETRYILSDSTLKEESFQEFFQHFNKDSTFQIRRIKFPLYVYEEDFSGGEDVVDTKQKEDWIFMNFKEGDNGLDQYSWEKEEGTGVVKLKMIGKDNGIYVEYVFMREQSEWFLVKILDFSM